MIISCAKCFTSYVVPDNAIGPQGRNVKCVKCSNSWFALPTTISQTTAKSLTAVPIMGAHIPPIPEGSALPAIVEAESFWLVKLPLMLLSLVLLTLVIIFYYGSIVKHFPSLERYYYYLGLSSSENLVLSDISVKKIVEFGNPGLFISGKLVNDSDKERYFPKIRISFKNINNNQLGSYFLNNNEISLKPHEEYPIATTITALPKDIEFVNVDLGNSLELYFQ